MAEGRDGVEAGEGTAMFLKVKVTRCSDTLDIDIGRCVRL